MKNLRKKLILKPEVIQKFKWGGTNLEWEEEASKLSNQLETIEQINELYPIDTKDNQKNK